MNQLTSQSAVSLARRVMLASGAIAAPPAEIMG